MQPFPKPAMNVATRPHAPASIPADEWACAPVPAIRSSKAGANAMRCPSTITPRSRSNQSIPGRSRTSTVTGPDGSTTCQGNSRLISICQPSARSRGMSTVTRSIQAPGSGSSMKWSAAWG